MHLTSHLYGSHSSILRIFLSLLHQLWCSIYICNEYQMPHWSSVALILKCHEFKQENHAEEISCTKTWWCFHFQSCHTLNTTWFSYEHSFLALYLLHLSVLLALRGFFWVFISSSWTSEDAGIPKKNQSVSFAVAVFNFNTGNILLE